MRHEDVRDEQGKGEAIRWDKSVSFPTLIAVITIVGGFWWWGTQTYAELKLADAANAQAIATLQVNITRVEKTQSDQQVGVRDDLQRINDKLDRLTDRFITPPSMKEWQKP